MTPPGWSSALQRGHHALTPRQKLMGTRWAEPGDCPHPRASCTWQVSASILQGQCIAERCESVCSHPRAPSKHVLLRLAPGTTCLALAQGQQSHLVTDVPLPQKDKAEITNNESQLLSPLLHTFFLAICHLGHRHHTRCHCREHPASLLPHLCFSQSCCPHEASGLQAPAPDTGKLQSLQCLTRAKDITSQRDILSQPVSPENLLGY